MNPYAMEMATLQKLSDYRRQAGQVRALRQIRSPQSWHALFAFVAERLDESPSKNTMAGGKFQAECCA